MRAVRHQGPSPRPAAGVVRGNSCSISTRRWLAPALNFMQTEFPLFPFQFQLFSSVSPLHFGSSTSSSVQFQVSVPTAPSRMAGHRRSPTKNDSSCMQLRSAHARGMAIRGAARNGRGRCEYAGVLTAPVAQPQLSTARRGGDPGVGWNCRSVR